MNTRQRLSFSFLELQTSSFRIQIQKNLRAFDELERDVISAIKFEAARIHFLSGVLVAVAVGVA